MGDPVFNTYDGEMILEAEPGLVLVTADITNASDPCSFTVAVKITPVVRQQRILYAASMPRYLRIEFCGLVIHLDQNFQVMVGSEIIDINAGPYVSDTQNFGGACDFTITKQISNVNGEQNFIVLESEKCGFHVGFEGDGINSVGVVKTRCNPHGGRMTGLCGDCNGIADDLRTCDTQQDVSMESDPYTLITESCRKDDSMDEWESMFGGNQNQGNP